MLRLRKFGALFPWLLLVSCGGGGDGTASEPSPAPTPPPAISPPTLMPQGVAVVKFRASGDGWAALTERLRRIEDKTAPDRRLLLAAAGHQPATEIDPPSGWSLIDFALHPSGALTLVLASDKQLRLQERASTGDLIQDSIFTDDEAATDPFVGNEQTLQDPQSLVPQSTRDAVELAPLGEDVLIAYRTGRNAVVAQRLTFGAGNTFQRRWRTVVEPGVEIQWVRLTSGTFDPFESLDNQWHLVLDVDSQGRSAIAVRVGGTDIVAGHEQYFGEPVDPALVNGAIVTRLDANGARLGATSLNTTELSEVHAVRWSGDSILVAGRVRTSDSADGGGWDGFVASVASDNTVARLQVLDFDRGDAVLDIAVLSDGRIAIAGAAGYTQNPTGASISEDSQPLLAILPSLGTPPQRVPLTAGSRQNQVRTASPWQGQLVIGGMVNGPGTHSGDSDPSLLMSDGFLHTQTP